MKKNKKGLFTFFGFILVIVIWETLFLIFNKSNYFPEFFECLFHSLSLFFNKSILSALLHTTLRLFISFFFSSILAIVLGILSGYYESFERVLLPIVTIMKSVPTIVLVLLLSIYVKNFSTFVVSFVVFPIIYEGAKGGCRDTYLKYKNEIILNGKNNLRNITDVILPLSLENIVVSFLSSLSLGFKVLITSETFSYRSSFKGLGREVYILFRDVEYKEMFYLVMFILLISIALDLILSYIKRRIEKLNVTLYD